MCLRAEPVRAYAAPIAQIGVASGATTRHYYAWVLRRKKAQPGANARPFPEALRAEARLHPDGWVYEIDSKYDVDGAIPPEGILGAWKVDENGDPTGDFQPNPNYRP